MARRAGVRPFNKNVAAGPSSAGRPTADLDTELEYGGLEAGGGLAPMGSQGRRPRRRPGDTAGAHGGLPSLAEVVGGVPAFAGFRGRGAGFEEEEDDDEDDDEDEDDFEEEDEVEVGRFRHEIKREMKRE